MRSVCEGNSGEIAHVVPNSVNWAKLVYHIFQGKDMLQGHDAYQVGSYVFGASLHCSIESVDEEAV